MPRSYYMSEDFSGKHRRWVRTYKGKKYSVTCQQLGLAPDLWTVLGSYQAANDWWIAKKLEIDQGEADLPPEVRAELKQLKTKKTILQTQGKDTSAVDFQIELTKQAPDEAAAMPDPSLLPMLARLEELGFDTAPLFNQLTKEEINYAMGADEFWQDKAANLTTEDRSISHHLKKWSQLMKQRVKPTTYSVIPSYQKIFSNIQDQDGKQVLSGEMPIACLTEQKLDEVFLAFANWQKDPETKKKQFVYFRSFIRYLTERKLIPALANIDSKSFVFKSSKKGKAPANVKKIKAFLATLPDRMKLYALLCINTAMNNIDIAYLEHGQVDFAKKTLTRKRVKTEDHANVPTVVYRLWPETIELLKQEMSDKSEKYMLLDKNNKPLYITEDKENGKTKIYDKIKSSWRDYFGRTEEKEFTLRDFRFFGGDLLEESPYKADKEAFLGHSPKTVSEKNYSRKIINVFEACDFIRSKLY